MTIYFSIFSMFFFLSTLVHLHAVITHFLPPQAKSTSVEWCCVMSSWHSWGTDTNLHVHSSWVAGQQHDNPTWYNKTDSDSMQRYRRLFLLLRRDRFQIKSRATLSELESVKAYSKSGRKWHSRMFLKRSLIRLQCTSSWPEAKYTVYITYSV